jgi:predicted phosphohydrolase
MKVQYCSDLHLEFWENRNYLKQNPIVPASHILIMAGDVMLFSEMYKHEDFFDFLSKSFKAVYWIPGNHEYYLSKMDGRTGIFKEQIRENVFLLNDTVEIIDDVRFVFSTLWSFIGKAAEKEIWHSMNDFRVIEIGGKKLTPAIYNKLHLESREFLTKTLRQKFDGPTVVVTHHVPTMQNYPPQYLGDSLNMAFASELKPLIEETQPEYWIYGHHHVNIPAYNIGKTTMLTNQLGYVTSNEFIGFDWKASFKVGKPKMPYVTFQENAEMGAKLLAKQRGATYAEMLASVRRVHEHRYADTPQYLEIKKHAHEVIEGRGSINRLSQEEEKGRINGWTRCVQATLLLNEHAGNDPEQSIKQQQEIEKYFNAECIWFDYAERPYDHAVKPYGKIFGDLFERGSEARLYTSYEEVVIKAIELYYSANPLDFLDRISLHNHLFPSTHYELIGFGKNEDGNFVAIVKQPYVKAERTATVEEIRDELEKYGFRHWRRNDYFNADHLLEDMSSNNVLIDVFGNFQFIDTKLSLNTDFGLGGIRKIGEAVKDAGHLNEYHSQKNEAGLKAVQEMVKQPYTAKEVWEQVKKLNNQAL